MSEAGRAGKVSDMAFRLQPSMRPKYCAIKFGYLIFRGIITEYLNHRGYGCETDVHGAIAQANHETIISDLAAVRFLRDDFRCHPERCSDERLLAFLQGVRQLTSDAEVGQLHGTRLRQQHVRRCSASKMEACQCTGNKKPALTRVQIHTPAMFFRDS